MLGRGQEHEDRILLTGCPRALYHKSTVLENLSDHMVRQLDMLNVLTNHLFEFKSLLSVQREKVFMLTSSKKKIKTFQLASRNTFTFRIEWGYLIVLFDLSEKQIEIRLIPRPDLVS